MQTIAQYPLKGGALIMDQTGIANATYSKSLSTLNSPHYKIFINDKKVIYSGNKTRSLIFVNSSMIKFKFIMSIIQITKKDTTGKTVYHVDPKDNIARRIYKITPQKSEQIQGIPKDFRPWYVFYNKLGFGVYGYGAGYSLYWANPTDDYVKKVKGFARQHSDTEATFTSEDGYLQLVCKVRSNLSLNGLPTYTIPLKALFKLTI